MADSKVFWSTWQTGIQVTLVSDALMREAFEECVKNLIYWFCYHFIENIGQARYLTKIIIHH